VLRLYGWHIFGLMLPAFGLLVWHLFRVRRDGGIAHAVAPGVVDTRLPRAALVRRELTAMLGAGGALLAVTALAAPALDGPLDLSRLSATAHAPWFFLWVQELLRLGDPLWMGVVAPVAALVVLAFLPYAIDRGTTLGRWLPRDGRLGQGLILALALAVGWLTLRGALR
jgi:quinol-cytochrome oxidoreductase complex cytochrome b subunit